MKIVWWGNETKSWYVVLCWYDANQQNSSQFPYSPVSIYKNIKFNIDYSFCFVSHYFIKCVYLLRIILYFTFAIYIENSDGLCENELLWFYILQHNYRKWHTVRLVFLCTLYTHRTQSITKRKKKKYWWNKPYSKIVFITYRQAQ